LYFFYACVVTQLLNGLTVGMRSSGIAASSSLLRDELSYYKEARDRTDYVER
jgi:hypothetical protein